jgi:hypothetical protein
MNKPTNTKATEKKSKAVNNAQADAVSSNLSSSPSIVENSTEE